MLCPNVLRKYSWDNEESSHDMTCMMRKHVHGGQWKCLNKCFLWAAPAVYLRQLHDPKEPKIVFPFWWDFIGISWLGQLVSLHHSHDVVVWQLRCPAGKCASHCRLLLMPLNFTLQPSTLPTTSINSLTHMQFQNWIRLLNSDIKHQSLDVKLQIFDFKYSNFDNKDQSP